MTEALPAACRHSRSSLRARTVVLLAVMLIAASACEGDLSLAGQPSVDLLPGETNTEPGAPTTPTTPTTPTEPEVVVVTPEFTAPQLIEYMRTMAQLVVSRPLLQAEEDRITADGIDALGGIITEWTALPAFAANARFMVERRIMTSGERDGIDFDLPGNLVEHVVRNDLPWSQVLTADFCVDAAGNETTCDSGAPYTAGVLTTRAYLASNASRFNLGRANRLMEVFACRIYPMESTLQPYLERSSLITMFRADTAEDQEDAQAANGFGNGDACYSCHGQFGAHAQVFVKFAQDGLYVADADGLQDPDGELGRSVNGLMTSHMADPAEAASEEVQFFGRNVANLSEAADVLVESPAFLPCQIRNFVHFAFGLPESTGVDPRVLSAIAEKVVAINNDPTLAEIAVVALTDPAVILSVVQGEGVDTDGVAP